MPNGDYIYLSYASDDVQESSLMRLNPLTGEETELLSGEFEALISVSPSGHYAAILTDDSGCVDRAAAEILDVFDPSPMENTQLELFDLETGASIFTRPATWQMWTEGWELNQDTNRFDQVSYYDSSDNTLTWLDDDFFLLQYNPDPGRDEVGHLSHHFVRIDDGVAQKQSVELNSIAAVLPNQDRFLVYTENGFGVYNYQAETLTPLVYSSGDGFTYSVRLTQIDDESATFLVQTRNYGTCSQTQVGRNYIRCARYTVRLP